MVVAVGICNAEAQGNEFEKGGIRKLHARGPKIVTGVEDQFVGPGREPGPP